MTSFANQCFLAYATELGQLFSGLFAMIVAGRDSEVFLPDIPLANGIVTELTAYGFDVAQKFR